MSIDTGHWTSIEVIEPDTFFGFVYCITHIDTGRFYIGKKQYKKHLKLKPLKGLKRKRKVTKDSDWTSYKGSSKHLQEFMKDEPESGFKFEILRQYKTKGGLYYGEVQKQVMLGCLEHRMECGELLSFNRQIAAVKFVPKEV